MAKKFIAYELPAEFVTDLTTDLQEVRAAQDDHESNNPPPVMMQTDVVEMIADWLAPRLR